MNNLYKKTIWYILVYSKIGYSETKESVTCDDNTNIRLDGLYSSSSLNYISCAQISSYLVNQNSCKYNCKKVRRVKKSSYQETGCWHSFQPHYPCKWPPSKGTIISNSGKNMWNGHAWVCYCPKKTLVERYVTETYNAVCYCSMKSLSKCSIIG